MSLTVTPYVCLSCRQATSRVLSQAARAAAVQQRGLSYTAAERRTTEPIKVNPTVSLRGANAANQASGTPEDAPLNRYSRTPQLVDVMLRQASEPEPGSINANSIAKQRSGRERTKAPSRAPSDSKTADQPIASIITTPTSLPDAQSKVELKLDGTSIQFRLSKVEDYVKQKDYFAAYAELENIKATASPDAIASFRDLPTSLHLALYELFKFLFNAKHGKRRLRYRTNKHEALRYRAHDLPLDAVLLTYCQILHKLNCFAEPLIAAILCHSLLAVADEQAYPSIPEQRRRRTVRDVMLIWRQLFALTEDIQSNILLDSPIQSEVEWHWTGLPSFPTLSETVEVAERSFNNMIEASLQTGIGKHYGEEQNFFSYTSAALLTTLVLKGKYAMLPNLQAKEICPGYRPLAAVFSAMLEKASVDLPPFLRKLHKYSIELPKLLNQELGLRSADWDLEAKPEEIVMQPLKLRAPSTFENTCNMRISRAIERQNPAQADNILVGFLQEVKDRGNDNALPQSLWERLVTMYLDMNLRARARQVLELMGKRGMLPSQKLWPALIRTSSQLNDREAIDRYWQAMLDQGITPDAHIWSARLFSLVDGKRVGEALGALESISQAWQAESEARAKGGRTRATKPTVEIGNAVIAAMCRHYDQNRAHVPKVLQWLARNSLTPDAATFAPLITQSTKSGKLQEAFSLLGKMQERGIDIDNRVAAALVRSLFESSYLDGRPETGRTQLTLDVLDDIETNYLKRKLDSRAYAVALDALLRRYQDATTAHALLARMKENKVETTQHIYTLLLGYYLEAPRPDVASLEMIWQALKSEDKGWGAKLDARFFDRALEGLSRHHEILGIDKINEILEHMPTMALRPSWPALYAVARVFVERGEVRRLQALVHRLRTKSHMAANDGSQVYGYRDFWQYIVEIGLLKDEGITSWEQVRARDKAAKFGTQTRASA